MWNASNATVLWVAEFLLSHEAITAPEARKEWQEQIAARYGGLLDIDSLPDPDREQALKALRDELLPAIVTDEWAAWMLPRFRLLTLIAADVLNPREWTTRP
jgi:hypothetical protein